jgi:hypothetical protein
VQRRQSIKHRNEHLAVGYVRRRGADDQGHAAPISDDVPLAAFFGPIRGIGAGMCPPFSARTLALSITPRERYNWPRWPKTFTSLAWILGQTPAWVQSRSRRQQVTGLPCASSAGKSLQGIPVRSTKMIPTKQARSDIRGRPPSGLGGSGGNRGLISSHNSSVSNSAIIASLLKRRGN